MCKHDRDTLQVRPWKLGHDVHVMDGHGRAYTGIIISSIWLYLGNYKKQKDK